MNPITPDLWQRMPWHAKARIISRLEARIEELRREVHDLERLPRYSATEATEYPTNWRDRGRWTDPQLRRAHAAHSRGVREQIVVVGEREWQRRRSAAQRDGLRASQMAIVKLMRDSGASTEEIATELGTSTRHTSRLLNDLALQENAARRTA